MESKSSKKPMLIMLISVGVLFGLVFLIKMFEKYEINKYVKKLTTQVPTVSAMQAAISPWTPTLEAVGSLRTVKGVNVTTELAGMIREIYFTPGAMVKKGDLLVQLDIDPDIAQLHSLQAQANLAKITYIRDKAQLKVGAVSQETVDTDEATYKSDIAQVVEQEANIAKKTIRAPFAGQLGISAVNIGQYLHPGDKVVTIETLDPIFVDFYLPQTELSNVKVGQEISMTVDSFPAKIFKGKITTVNPIIDKDSRNIEVEATLPNPQLQLMPGMFSDVSIVIGTPVNYLTLPQAAISYNSYGNIVYVLKKTDQTSNGLSVWKATQTFVTTGQTRGDQIAVLKGINSGDIIVTSGQLKLKNNSLVTLNNSIEPANSPNPHPAEE